MRALGSIPNTTPSGTPQESDLTRTCRSRTGPSSFKFLEVASTQSSAAGHALRHRHTKDDIAVWG
eukprot:691416-Rhodomonas_salina.1